MRYAPAARNLLAAGVVLAAFRALGVIAFTYGLAHAVSSFFGESVPSRLAVAIGGLIVLVFSQWAFDAFATWTGNRVTAQLRQRALSSFRSEGTHHSDDVTVLLTTGVDAVSRYVVSVLPATISTVVFTPILAVALWVIDPLSGVAVAVTIPLIPLFMVLIGKTTQATQSAQWNALTRLSVGFSEIVGGLTTLMLFGRERRQGPRIRDVTERYRESTMKVLRLSFLSSFALEIGASLAVAVVAVSIGIRLVDGSLALATGLWVLVLVPEAFTAIRQVGARFHASADGLAVADRVFDIIESEAQTVPSGGGHTELIVESLAIEARLRPLSFRARQGQVTVLSGPSGAGKSTIIDAIRGDLAHSGSVILDDAAVSPLDCSWAPQHSVLMGSDIASAITWGGVVETIRLTDSIRLAGIELPAERSTIALSGGQSQRVSLARAYYRALTMSTPVILLDEPTSALDESSEQVVIGGLQELASRGYIVVVASHRPAVLAAAHHLVEVAA